MRTGLFGGVFDPIHAAHLALARAALQQARLDRVFFIPTALPPHKAPATASAAHRLALVRLAVAGEPHLFASDLERRGDRPAYTHETLARFARRHPDDELFFLCGADSLLQIPAWRDPRALLSRATLIAAPRPGAATDPATLAPEVAARTRMLDLPPVELSSTALRRLLASPGRAAARAHLPDAVYDYIERHGLYR